jgi:hypothetical protein
MMDLTKINVPFGLLDADTQAALKAHGGPYETYANYYGWSPVTTSFRPTAAYVYRVKPQPPKPREWWINPEGKGLVLADDPSITFSPPWVLAREVLPE